MTVEPEILLAFDRGVTWPDSQGTLRRVVGPVLALPDGETLTWMDPVDGRPQATSALSAGGWDTFVTTVEWPEGYPDGLSGAAVGVGDPSAVVEWRSSPEWFSTDRGIGCVVVSPRVDEVARLLEDFSFVGALLAAVRALAIHPLEVAGQVAGVAFHCGMGASTNRLHVGHDEDGRAVAVLADLDLLTDAELAP